MEKKPAAAYMRMSTDKQEHSIESQWRLIQEYARRNNYQILKRYEDEGISGRAAEKRPAFLRMIDESENGLFSAVLIYDSSRFARNLKDSIVYKSILKQNGVELISITEPILDEDNALITDALLGAMNEMYSRKLSKNVRRGQEQKVLRGESFSLPPFGYRRPEPGKPFVIVPEEAEIVRYIFSEYRAGRSSYGLAVELSQAGVKTRRGNPFDNRQVEYILTNPTYKGYLRVKLNGQEHYTKSDHPAIISEEEFDRMQEFFKERQSRKGERQMPKELHRHWLSGKIRCEICGGAYSYNRSYGGRMDNFRCTNRMKGKCLESPTIRVRVMEQLFLQSIQDLIANPEQFKACLVPVKSPVSRNYELELRQAMDMLRRAKESYLAGIDSLEEYKNTKFRLEERIARIQLDKEKDSLPPAPDFSELKERLSSAYTLLTSDADLAQKQSCIEDLVDRIVVNGPSRTITPYFFF